MKKCVLAVRRVSLFASVLLVARLVSAQTATDYHMPVVTIHATDPFAAESGDTATFEVDRDGPTNATLNVFYQIGGTASNGVDYATLSHWVTVPAGVRSASISIDPVGDTAGETNEEGTKTIVLQLTPSPLMIPLNYLIGYPSKAAAFLFDDDASSNRPPAVTIIQPMDGAQFYAPTNISIIAAAGDWDGWVTNVEFFVGTNDLGQGSLVPRANLEEGAYSLTWSNAPLGNYALTAVATDNRGASITSDPVNINVAQRPPRTNQPPVVSIVIPFNGESFTTPVNVAIFARADDPDGYVKSVEFFEGTNSLGEVSGGSISPAGDPIGPILPSWPAIIWSNVPPGSYVLTAVATDNEGAASTSAPVDITVTQIPPLSNSPPVIISPTEGMTFHTPTNIRLTASISYLRGPTNVEFFANTNDLGRGILGWSSGFGGVLSLTWTNPPPGDYALAAVGAYLDGTSLTSAPVNITVLQGPPPTNQPPVVRIISPANNMVFRAPINIPLYAYARDPDGTVTSVEFMAGTNSLGLGQAVSPPPIIVDPNSPTPDRDRPDPPVFPTNIFSLVWSNAPAGAYTLTAKATDDGGASTVSRPIHITILVPPPPPTNRPAIVSIVATDPLAIEGTNCWRWRGLTNSPPTWATWHSGAYTWFTNCGPKNAVFTVRRWGNTNKDLTLAYDVEGTASNGVDYATLPGWVTIPAGEHDAMITVVPIDDGPPDVNKSVVLKLGQSTNTPPDYALGLPRKAAVMIYDSDGTRPLTGMLPGNCFHVSTVGPDGAWFRVEYSTNLMDWTSICTNQVVDGSIDFLDPDAKSEASRFYRIVPEDSPPPQ